MEYHTGWPLRSATAAILLAALCASVEARSGETGTAPLDREGAVRTALQNNPDVRTAQVELSSARARVAAAGMLSPHNPEIEGTLGQRFAPGERSTEVEVSLSQRIEIAGQRGLRRRAADAGLAAAADRLEHVRARIRSEVEVAFVDLLLARQEIGFSRESLALSEDLHRAAAERRDAGAATDLGVNLAAVELAQARRDLLLSMRARRRAELRLHSLLALGPDEPLEITGALESLGPLDADLADLVALAVSRRRDLRTLDDELAERRAEVELAEAGVWPDLTLSLGYALEESSDHIASVGLAVELPVFNRNRSEKAAASGRLGRIEVERAATRLAVENQVAQALDRYRVALEIVEVFDRDILAQLARNLQLLHVSFEAGKIGLLQVLSTQRDLTRTRAEYAHNLAELHRARARLELAAGGPIP